MELLATAPLSGTHFKLLSYESGPAGEGDGSATDLAIQAHRNPRMKEILSSWDEQQLVMLVVRNGE